jgi:signal transduction histidine kinase
MENLKVLIVDDEPGIRSGIQRILKNFSVGYPFLEEDFQYELFEAASGEEALEQINKLSPDIILLDNKLPGIEGMEVLEQINKRQLDAVVMMITSYASLELAVKATNNGAFNFVPKPFTPQELRGAMETITKHLFLKRMTRKMNKEGKQIRFQFLQVLSHELKSPINAVEGYLKMMQERQVGDNLADYDKMIERSLERIKGMRHLIMDLLDLTKIESGKKNRELKEIDISEIARVAIDSMEAYAIQRNVKIYFDSNENIKMIADADEIEIIFNNLISNAIKYNKEGGHVNFSIVEGKGEINIIVEDTGIGMTKEETEKLFQEFMRIKNIKTQNISGSGLGLSIVKKLVELNNGEIKVRSIPDEGTIFTVTFKEV